MPAPLVSFLFTAACLWISFPGEPAMDAVPSIIPRPLRIEPGEGRFVLVADTPLLVTAGAPEALPVAAYLAEFLRAHLPFDPAVGELAAGTPPRGSILLALGEEDTALGAEGYTLYATKERVELRATAAHGLFNGVQTLLQLMPPRLWTRSAEKPVPEGMGVPIPAVRILDRPRFAWRGLHLDVSRHFFSKAFVKRLIDLLAIHKMNRLHLHLTDDQGWRIAVEKYPRLTGVGAWRMEGGKRYGGFYTKEDLREIAAYGQRRFVTVIPEIEMPGHAMAALAAYPELSCTGGPFTVPVTWGVFKDVYCAGKEETFTFLEGVLDEVLPLFPGAYVHIGGDECPKDRWKACPRCRARIEAEGLSDEKELQSWFIRRIERFLSARGKRLVGWDEIMEGGLAPGAVVMSWRGVEPGIRAAEEGHDVILCPTSHCYFDYRPSDLPGEPGAFAVIPLEKVYAFEPCPEGLSPTAAKHILGVQGNVWTERMETPEQVEYMAFPRACALSEVAWSPREGRVLAGFMARLAGHLQRLDGMGVHYRVPPPRGMPRDRTFTDAVEVSLSTPLPGAEIRYTLDGSDPGPSSPCYEKALHITESRVVKARLCLPGGRSSVVVTGRFEKEAPRKR